jgi:hypothetical protein
MNYRERLIRTIQFKEVDELPFRHAYGLMPGVLESWHKQGLPESVRTEKDIYQYFGFPVREKALPVLIGFDPPFETTVLEDNKEYMISMDWMGRRVKVIKSSSTIPLAMEFPITDEKSWKDYKRRLAFSETRIGGNLEEVVKSNIADGLPNKIGVAGFFWFPRDLMGDEYLCLSYYERPELVHDILNTWCTLIENILELALERVKVDIVHLGEDMAYKNASMVGKDIFDEFIRPYYLRIQKLVGKYEIPIFSVDSDGCLDELIHWFADCGVNYIGPNEVGAGNDITAYRREFGQHMAFDGGLEKKILLYGREAIDEMLENKIPFMKSSGGGWSVCLDHRVLEGTRLEDFKHYVSRTREMIRF